MWNRALTLTKVKQSCKCQVLPGVLLHTLPFQELSHVSRLRRGRLVNLCKAQTRLLNTFGCSFICVALFRSIVSYPFFSLLFLPCCVRVQLFLYAIRNNISLHSGLCLVCYLCLHLLFVLCQLFNLNTIFVACWIFFPCFYLSVKMHCAVLNYLINTQKLGFYSMFIVMKGWQHLPF